MSKPATDDTASLFIKQLNRYPKLFNETPPLMFHPSIMWPKFNEVIKKPFVVFVTRPGLSNMAFSIERSEPLALGQLHFIHSANLHVGYAFEFSLNPEIKYNPHYIVAHNKNITFDYKIAPEVVLTNQYMTVYNYAEDLVFAGRKRAVYETVKP